MKHSKFEVFKFLIYKKASIMVTKLKEKAREVPPTPTLPPS